MNEMLQFSMRHGGAVLFVVVLLEQTGVPIPAAPCLLAAGVLCATGKTSPAAMIGVTVLACLIADGAWFYVGRRCGKRVLQFLNRLTSSHYSRVEELERNFTRHAMPVLAFAKFIPGLSIVVPPLAGAVRIGVGQFLLFDSLGSVLYAGGYLLLGSAFSGQAQAVFDMIS